MHLLYKTTNLKTGKIYIGVHTTDIEDDGYMGSSKILKEDIKELGIENFKREIIKYCDSVEEALTEERNIVNDEFIRNTFTYNRTRGGRGGWFKLNPKLTCTVKDKDGNKFRVSRTDPRFLSGELVGTTKGHVLSEEHKQQISKLHKGKINSEETKRLMSESAKGRKWMYKDNLVSRVIESNFENYLQDGWKFGKPQKKP